MRRNSCTESATAAVAIRIGWPSRWRACSGAITARPTSMLQPPEIAAASRKASARPRDRVADAERDRRRDPADRPIGAEHRDLAERQIDPPDQPVDQRIGGREQRIDGRKRDRVDELLQRVGGSRAGIPAGRCARRRPARASRSASGQLEALEVEEPRVAERAARRSHRHQIEPVALERGAAEAAGDDMRPVGRARLARRVVDAHPGAGRARRRDADFADLGPSGCSAGSTSRHSRTCSESIARPQPAARSGSRSTAKRQPAHGATIREPPDFVPRDRPQPLARPPVIRPHFSVKRPRGMTMPQSEPKRIGLNVEVKPHAYDPATQPELFEGVLARRVMAFLIDLIIISVPLIFLAIFIFMFGLVTLGLGWFLFFLYGPDHDDLGARLLRHDARQPGLGDDRHARGRSGNAHLVRRAGLFRARRGARDRASGSPCRSSPRSFCWSPCSTTAGGCCTTCWSARS